MAPAPPLIKDPVPYCFQVLRALRKLLHLACHRRSLYFAERELDGKSSSISAAKKLYVRPNAAMHFRKVLTRFAVLTNNRGLLLLRRHENSRETNQARARKRNCQEWALRDLRG